MHCIFLAFMNVLWTRDSVYKCINSLWDACQILMGALNAKRRRGMRAFSVYDVLACNYMQRPKNAAALSHNATKRKGGFYEIEEFRARTHLSFVLFLSLEGLVTEVPLFFIERPRPKMTMKLMNGLPPTPAINVILPHWIAI